MKITKGKLFIFVLFVMVFVGTFIGLRMLVSESDSKGTEVAVSEPYLLDEGKSEPEGLGLPVLMELGSDTCTPCKMMKPVLDEIAHEYEGIVEVQIIDVYERRDLANKYRIYTIPTQIFIDKDGKELGRHEGYFPKSEIVAKMKQFGWIQ